jgi:UPF0755 protein
VSDPQAPAQGPVEEPAEAPIFGSHRAEPVETGRRRGCLPLIVAVVVVLALVFVLAKLGVSRLDGLFSGPADFDGPGTGRVVVQVHAGDTSTAIGHTLRDLGVVRSVGAFTDAARSNAASRSIQVGYYSLRKQMKASAALDVLINPKNLIQSVVTIPEGARLKDIVAMIVAKTDITRAALDRALAHPASIGLPAEAKGNAEGFLFPATYTVVPKETATELLSQMAAKSRTTLKSLDVASGAARLGLSETQILTVASILEYEGSRDQDYPKIARGIYNRLRIGMKIQSDATVAYANNLKGTVWTTQAQRDNPSPYNTYMHAGLPPGPIGTPGEKTINAALHPVDGTWLYWLVVDLRTGETRFENTLAEQQRDKQVLLQYCQTSTAC